MDILGNFFYILNFWQVIIIAVIIILIILLIKWKSTESKTSKILKSFALGIFITVIILILNFYIYLVNGIGFLEKIFDIFTPYSYMVGIVEQDEKFGLVYKEIVGIDSNGRYIFEGIYTIPEIKENEGEFLKVVIDKGASIMESVPAGISRIKSVEVINEEEVKKELNNK